MVCKNCGNNIPDNVMFCSKCGTPVKKEKETVKTVKNKKGSKKGLIIGIVSVVVVAVIVISIFVSGFMSTKEMRDALEINDSILINEIYARAWNDTKLLKKYDELIAERLDEFIEDINSQDFTEQAKQDAGDGFDEYVHMTMGDFYDELNFADSIYSKNYAKWEELFELIESKESYYVGVYDYANGNYESAVDLFSWVIESDSNYESAKDFMADSITEYISVSMEEAQTLIDSGDISGGIELLTSAKEYIDELGIDSAEINDLINSTLTEYAAKYAEKAEIAFNEHDIDAAIGNIEVALELQPDNADYKTKYDTYELYKPYALYLEENCILIEDDEDFWASLTFDCNLDANNGQEFNHCIKWYNNNDNINASDKAIFDLNGKYDIVSGTIFLRDSNKNTELSGYLEFYGDGKLLFTTSVITGGVLPEEFEFSVSDVQRLAVAFHGEGEGGFLGVGPSFGVSNLQAQKAFPEQ